MINLSKIPSLPQRQDSTTEQLLDLKRVANRLGMYDAADMLDGFFNMLKPTIMSDIENIEKENKYGCHCDLDVGQTPDGCVIDEGKPWNCIYATKGIRKEQCEWWRPL